MRDMEQEAEPEGGPIADKYGDMLNKIDAALAKAKGTEEKSYSNTFKEGWNDQDGVFSFGYNLDMIQAVIDHLKSNYSEQDYELHVGRGDTHPNAVTLKNPDMDNDEELGNLLIAAEDQEETDYQSGRELEKDYVEENVDKVTGGIPYRQHGNKVIISEPLDDATKERLMQKAEDHGYFAQPNMAGGITITLKKGMYEKKRPGLWANINAKRKRGEKPAHGNSNAHKDAVKAGNAIKEENKLSSSALNAIAHQAGEAVAKAIITSGDEISSAKIKKTYSSSVSPSTPEIFTVHVIYKNDNEESYRFEIQNSKLIFLSPKGDIEISDVGIKPSGEARVNTDLIKNEMTKYFKGMNEQDIEQKVDDRGKPSHLAMKLSDKDKASLQKIAALIKNANKKEVKEDDVKEAYSKEKLLAVLGQADDAMIRTTDGKSLIIYNPNNGNDDNTSMWNDDTVFAVDQDGGEHEIRYDQIEDFQLEEDKYDYNEGIDEDSRHMDQVFGALGYRNGFDEFIEDNPGAREALHGWISSVPDFRERLGREYSNDELGNMGFHDIAGYDNEDNEDGINEESELDKVISAKKMIKQLAPEMNTKSQSDPERIAFIKQVKQVNKKYKELVAKQDDKISRTGRDQELDEGRGDFDDVLKAVQNMSNNDDISEKEAALEIVYALADKFKIPVDKNLEDYMEEGGAVKEQSCKVGDILTKDGKKGKVIKHSETQATVDFGNGDVYGIAHSRIKGGQIHEDEVDDRDWANWSKDLGDTIDKVKSKIGIKEGTDLYNRNGIVRLLDLLEGIKH